MRFGFVTCVQLGLSCMEEIYAVGGHLDLVITLPDSAARTKSGRVYVDSFCETHGIDLVKSPNVNDAAVLDAIRAHEIDWLFIIGWSQIARREVLNAPQRGVLGMHPTLLPIGRGRAAIPWTILLGLEESGVTLFKLDEGVDTGPIVSQARISVDPRETATTLYKKVNQAHRTLIQDTWPRLASDQVDLRIQDDSLATVWAGRRPEDGAISPEMSAEEVDRLVRAVTHPYPGAFVDLDGERLRIWRGEPKAIEDGRDIPVASGVYTALDSASEPPV
ncbi:MAG: methionyl-tRNA formyltransferase [Rubricoccaceae bacterium]